MGRFFPWLMFGSFAALAAYSVFCDASAPNAAAAAFVSGLWFSAALLVESQRAGD